MRLHLMPLWLVLGLSVTACGDKDDGGDGSTDTDADGTDTDGTDTDTDGTDTDTDGTDTDTDGTDSDTDTDGTDTDTDTDGTDSDTDTDGTDTDTDTDGTDTDTDTDGSDTDTDTDGTEVVDADEDGYPEDVDCDDTGDTIYPGATERCDGVDNDCDDLVDDDDPGVTGTTTVYMDEDGDGWGDDATEREACDWTADEVEDGGDCDDDDEEVNPTADEVCDGVDNDCDGDIDDDDSDVEGLSVWYEDEDEDGYGRADRTTVACDPGDGWSRTSGDCDDDDADINPAEEEVCDEVDNDCDGDIDDDDSSLEGAYTWYRDSDRDGYGDDDETSVACDLGSAWSRTGGDCDDDDYDVNPGADEVCDDADTDEDCDGRSDDDDSSVTDEPTWYRDADGDGYGVSSTTTVACDPGDGWALESGDCDDGDDEVFADRTWYRDLDGDGYGDDDVTDSGCVAPTDYVAIGGDCNDLNAYKNPGATEVCDDTDNDCDELVDDEDDSLYADETGTAYFWDDDGDGYGDAATSLYACTLPTGYVENATDCNDDDDGISPAATEICDDGIDQDCDELPGDCGIATGHWDDDRVADHHIYSSGYYLGYQMDYGGDYDKDGEPDLVVANQAGTGGSYGYVYAFDAPFTAYDYSWEAPVYMEPDDSYSEFATDLAWVSDVNSDGWDDLIVGAPYESGVISTGYKTDIGYAYVFSGRYLESAADEGDAMIALSGSNTNQFCGMAVAGGVDIDDDREDDFAVSCPGASRVGLFLDTPTSGLAASKAQVILNVEGYQIELGDVDGDGIGDVLIGNENDETDADGGGVIWLFNGPFTADVDLDEDDADGVRYGARNEYLGRVIEVPGDTDGDGYNEIAYSNSIETRVELIAGGAPPDLDGTPAVLLEGSAATGGFSSIAGGDFNDDGLVDLVLGAPSWRSSSSSTYYRGAIFVAYAPFDATETLGSTTYVYGDTADKLGQQVATGDLNDDGMDDVIASCPGCGGVLFFESGWY